MRFTDRRTYITRLVIQLLQHVDSDEGRVVIKAAQTGKVFVHLNILFPVFTVSFLSFSFICSQAKIRTVIAETQASNGRTRAKRNKTNLPRIKTPLIN